MANVTKIDWTLKTADQWWSGTDSQVKIEIYRDNTLIKRLNLEPGRTPRLSRSELATYYWVFRSPDGIGVAVSGTAVPHSEAFPQGIRGHLRVKLVAKGDDAWEKAWIESTIYSGQLKGIPGTIDSVAWVEDWDTFMFNRDLVLSTDRSEGFSSLTLLYSGKVPSSSSDRCDYTEVLELLIAAGADVRAVGPTGSQTMDDLLRRYGGGPG